MAATGLPALPLRCGVAEPEFASRRRPADVTEPDSHTPVLRAEVLAALRPCKSGLYVDCTFGRGGHTRALLERLGPSGRVLAIDRDPAAVAAARSLAAADPRVTPERASFSSLRDVYHAVFGESAADGVLFDLGVSSPQLEDPARGFSFLHDGPLDMRMDPGHGQSAAQWLQGASEAELVDVLRRLGEEPLARRIARAIVERRIRAPIRRTRDLAELVVGVKGYAAGRRPGRATHPATATFRALRMVVNQELGELERGLEQSAQLLSPGGRLVVISFHSLEDRLTKRFIQEYGRGPRLPRALPVEDALLARPAFHKPGRAIRAGSAEVARNPRARSACMRIGEKK